MEGLILINALFSRAPWSLRSGLSTFFFSTSELKEEHLQQICHQHPSAKTSQGCTVKGGHCYTRFMLSVLPHSLTKDLNNKTLQMFKNLFT